MKPNLESLEARDLLSVLLSLNGTALTALGSQEAAHNILLRPDPAGGFDLVADGMTTTYPALTQFNYRGGAQADVVVNRTTVPGTLAFGNGNVQLFTIAPGTTVLAGDGNDILQSTGGRGSTIVGNGNSNIYGGPGDQIQAGSGVNVVYDILGTNTVRVAPHQGLDHLYVSAASTLTGSQPGDKVAQFFAAGRGVGSGTLVFDPSVGTLYFTADNAGDTYVASQIGNTLFVATTTAAGTKLSTFDARQVKLLANFGGAGNDVFVNTTTIDDVQYGAGGNNVLLGGFGSFDLEKAGGAAATQSFAWGRSPIYNDLNGSGVPGTTTVLFTDPRSFTIFRSNSTSDVLGGVSFFDAVLTLYPDQGGPKRF